mgnify:CR=1 FL=1
MREGHHIKIGEGLNRERERMSTKRDSDGEESEDNVRVFNVFRRDERVYDRRRIFYDLY